MSRTAGLDAPGVLHHVVIRGIQRRHIFRDDNDRDDFPGRIEGLLPETHIVCYAWAVMSNYAHFLFRTGDVPLSMLMQALADVRGLFCCWAVEKLGYKLIDLAKRFGMTGPGVGYAVRRGRKIAQDRRLKLSCQVIYLFTDVPIVLGRPQDVPLDVAQCFRRCRRFDRWRWVLSIL